MTIKLPDTLNLTAMIEGFYNGSLMVPDTATIELRKAVSPFALLESHKVLLNNLGTGKQSFNNVVEGTEYYIVLKHRNSVETWSKLPQSFTGGALTYNFTTDSTKAYGNNLTLKGTKWCLFSGEVTNNYFIEYNDLIQVYNFYLLVLENPGYYIEDVTGNGFVEYDDLVLVYNNYFAQVYSHNPLNPVLSTRPIKGKKIEIRMDK